MLLCTNKPLFFSSESFKAKVQKVIEPTSAITTPTNQAYSRNTAVAQISPSTGTSYGYSAITNPWGAYAASAQNVSLLDAFYF